MSMFNFTILAKIILNPLVYEFSIKYDIGLTEYNYKANIDNYRFISRFPRWSSASNTFFSNTSKVLSPSLETYSAILAKVQNIAVNNINKEFGYSDSYNIYIAPPEIKVPKSILSDEGLLTHIGEHNTVSISDYPITRVNLIEDDSIMETQSVDPPIIFIVPYYIFIQSDLASIDNPINIIVYGVDIDGHEVSEIFNLLSNEYTISSIKYKLITRIIGDNYQILNSLDLNPIGNQISYVNDFGPQKRVTESNGNYIQPRFTVENNYITVINSNSITNTEVSKFLLSREPDKIFISNLLDIIYLKDNILYSSKFYYDIVNKNQYNSTYNNNDFINIDSETPIIGETIKIKINTELIGSFYGKRKFKIKKITGQSIVYIDLNGDVLDENIWIEFTDKQSHYYINKEIEENIDITYVLKIPFVDQEYCAGYYFNNLPEFKLASDIDDIKFQNHELIIYKDDKQYILDCIRPFFTSTKSSDNLSLLVFDRDYQELAINV